MRDQHIPAFNLRLSRSEVDALARLAVPIVEEATEAVGSPPPPGLDEKEEAEWWANLEKKIAERKAEEESRREHAASVFTEELAQRSIEAYQAGRAGAISSQARRAVNIRGYVLFGVVAAVVCMPLIGMLLELDPQAFGAYIAPVMGIAGTVVGYWFGTVGQGVPGEDTTTQPSADAYPRPRGKAARPGPRPPAEPS